MYQGDVNSNVTMSAQASPSPTPDLGTNLDLLNQDTITVLDNAPDQDITTNIEVEEWSKGRATSLFTAAVFSGFTLVLVTSYWLTRDGEHGLSPKPLYFWEIILYLAAVSSMVAFSFLRDKDAHVMDTYKPFSDAYMDTKFDKKENSLPNWTYVRVRHIAMYVCCAGCLVLPLSEVYRIIPCFGNSFEEFRVVYFVSNICRAMFCVCQLIFLLRNKTKAAKNRLLRHSLSTVMAANFTLCVDLMMYVTQANDTVNIKTEPNNVVNMSAFKRKEMPVFVACSGSVLKVDFGAEWIYEITYQFPIEFAVLSLCYFGTIWNVFKPAKITENSEPQEHTRRNTINRQESFGQDGGRQRQPSATSADQEGQRRTQKYRIITICENGIQFASTWAFPLSFIFVVCVFGFILFMEVTYLDSLSNGKILVYEHEKSKDERSNVSDLEMVYVVTQTVYIYIICIVAPAGFMLARKEKIAHKRLNASDKLLLAGGTGHLIFILFETVDFTDVIIGGRSDAIAVLFFIKLLLKYQGVFAETMIVLIASKMAVRLNSIENGRQKIINGIIVFLGMFNTERWFTDNFLPPNVLRYVDNIGYNEMYGQKTWWFLVEFLYPFVMIFRLAMTIMCYETCVRLKREHIRLQQEASV